MPLACVVVVLVLEAHGNTVFVEAPQFLDEAVLVLLLPLAGQKLPDGFAASEELAAVAPLADLGVGEGHAGGVTRVPGVFGEAGLLRGGFEGEGG